MHLGINIVKKIKGFHNVNYKTTKKEIEEDTRRCKDLQYSWIERINIVQMAIDSIEFQSKLKLNSS